MLPKEVVCLQTSLVLLGFRGRAVSSLRLEGLLQLWLNVATRRLLQKTYLEKDSSYIMFINLRSINQFVIIIHYLHWLNNLVPSPTRTRPVPPLQFNKEGESQGVIKEVHSAGQKQQYKCRDTKTCLSNSQEKSSAGLPGSRNIGGFAFS